MAWGKTPHIALPVKKQCECRDFCGNMRGDNTVCRIRKQPAVVTQLRADRPDLQRLVEEIKEVVYRRAGAMSIAEVVGAVEIVKLEIISEQKT